MFWAELKRELIDSYKFRNVMFSFVRSNLKMRYRRSFLGFLWTVVAPMIHYLIIGIVFSVVNRVNMDNYFIFMFSGAIIFNVITGVIGRAPGIYIGNEQYIKKIYLPKLLYSLNSVALELINFTLSLSALIVLGIIFKKLTFSWALLYLPLPIVIISLFLVGISIIIGTLSVYFRDMFHIIPAVMQAAFFGTPILYPFDMLSGKFKQVVSVNPFMYMVDSFRDPIVNLSLPSMQTFIITVCTSVFVFVLGMYILIKYNNKIVFKL